MSQNSRPLAVSRKRPADFGSETYRTIGASAFSLAPEGSRDMMLSLDFTTLLRADEWIKPEPHYITITKGAENGVFCNGAKHSLSFFLLTV